MSASPIHYMDEDSAPKLEVEPNRRCFLAMQIPSGSTTDLYQNTIIQPPSRRFSAIELNAEELARRLLMIESPPDLPRGFFGERVKRNSKRRSYECSVFEVVDLGPVSRDKGSTNSLGPAAVHRVSIRRRRPGSDKSEASKSVKSRSSVKSNKSTKDHEVREQIDQKATSSKRKPLLCCCRCEDSDDEAEISHNSARPFCPTTDDSPNVLLKAKRRLSKLTQFFETIAPREGFKDDDGLDDYLHERSKKLQPKDGPKPPDVKPRHPPHVLRSPGIKPPKGNHYAREHPASAHLVPTTPSPRDYDGSKPSPSMTGPSSKTNQEDFAIIDINPGQQPRYIGDVTRRQAPTTSNFPLGPVPKKAPPPLHPRKTRQPVSNGPPIRSPSVFTPLSANWKPPAPSPPELANKSPRLNQHAQAFIFPEIPFPSGSPTPQRPAKAPAPLRPQATASTSAEHRVTLPVPGSPSGDSPSVSVSLPPPSLPPRVSRPGSASTPPPPRPPKPGHMTSSPLATPRSLAPSTTSVSTNAKSVSSSQSAESPPPPPSSNPEHYSPPPLPPKTYKSRRQSSSPTN